MDRYNFKEIEKKWQYHWEKNNLYKSQVKKKDELNTKSYLEDVYHQGYKTQLEFYSFLFKEMGFEVDQFGYFIVCNGSDETKTQLRPYFMEVFVSVYQLKIFFILMEYFLLNIINRQLMKSFCRLF